jgi:hypothetical protein
MFWQSTRIAPHSRSRLLSERNTLDVTLDTHTQTIFPRRGILAEFWAIGCPTPKDPIDEGYLIGRNDTDAILSCSMGHVFLPEMERRRNSSELSVIVTDR